MNHTTEKFNKNQKLQYAVPLKANDIHGGRENSNVSPTHRKLYNYTTAAKSQMVVSTALNNLIRNDPFVKIIYTNGSWYTGY
jgi:hypothetical protein